MECFLESSLPYFRERIGRHQTKDFQYQVRRFRTLLPNKIINHLIHAKAGEKMSSITPPTSRRIVYSKKKHKKHKKLKKRKWLQCWYLSILAHDR